MSKSIADRYAVFGNPIGHSKSPQIHSAFAAQTGQNLVYSRQCIPAGRFKSAVDQFFAGGGQGLNITVPFKLEAYDYPRQLTERARRAGAVNTLMVKDQHIIGDNTDGVGLLDDMRCRLGWRIEGARILVMGAGGAVRGVLAPLLSERPQHLIVVNRNKLKAQQLLQLLIDLDQTKSCHYCNYEELNKGLEGQRQAFDIIINGTSASLSSELPPLADHLLHPASHCYDMVYGGELTRFLRWAQQRGVTALSDGLGMLVCQAAESFYQWRGVRPDVQPVIQQLTPNS